LRADFGALPVAPGSLDLVLANPPYVSRAEHAELAPGVRDFEPASALVPHPVGETGLESAAALLPQARRALRPGGWLLMELGWTQGPAVLELLAAARPGWSEARVLPDLAGRDRVAAARV
jgi:release factor glutamine methyltransferase